MTTKKTRELVKQVLVNAFFILSIFSVLIPILYALSVSLSADSSLLSSNFSFISKSFTLSSYKTVFTDRNIISWFVNTVYLAVMTVLLSLGTTIPAAYVFSRWSFSGRKGILKVLILLYSFPSILSMFALYRLMSRLSLINTHIGLIIIYAGTMSVFSLWNLKGYFDTIPIEIEEAAKIDGATDRMIVVKIVLPLARPSIIVTMTMVLNYVWNEYIFSINFLTGSQNTTLASGLYALQATEKSGSWPVFAAASIVVSIPVLIIFFMTQKYMTSGLTSGGVKG
jgi:arabinogalactan oligomer / maltooligosaccharide transport system permease protein